MAYTQHSKVFPSSFFLLVSSLFFIAHIVKYVSVQVLNPIAQLHIVVVVVVVISKAHDNTFIILREKDDAKTAIII